MHAQLLLAIALAAAAPLAAASTIEDVEAWLRAKRLESPYDVAPGVTAAVVADGTAHTFGVGFQAGTVAADENTLMQIGSLSKTMVALGLATLVTKRALAWDDPVREYLGANFSLGTRAYVSEVLTVRDLLTHRTGLAQGQGDVLSYFVAPAEAAARLGAVEPLHTLRARFDYSNTGWMLAGEVLRAATGAASWCEALHATLLAPLNLTRTFCHRNELPAAVAARHLAAVHKANPCGRTGGPPSSNASSAASFGPLPLAAYDFVATGSGNPSAFAWGAASAAGSVISSAADMAVVLRLLLGVNPPPAAAAMLTREVVEELMTGQMVTPASFAVESGVPGWGAGERTAGHAAATGLGFDLVLSLDLIGGRSVPYAEKSGDTDMHKARLGVLPDDGAAVLLLSNLGGSVGGPLTALKFGVAALLAGGSAADADAAAARALNTTGFLANEWVLMNTCSPCGRVADISPCVPGGRAALPLPAGSWAGSFGTPAYGGSPLLTIEADTADTAGGSSGLVATLGPYARAPLGFSAASSVLPAPAAPQNASCLDVAAFLLPYLAPWAGHAAAEIASLVGDCAMAELILPPEVPAAGVSASNGTVAFPWGCGAVPLPDGPSVFVVSHQGRGVFATYGGESLFASK